MQLDRRTFLGGLGAVGAGLALRAPSDPGPYIPLLDGGLQASGLQPSSAAQRPAPHRIDIHQHFISPGFLAALTARNATTPVPGLVNWKGWTPARAIEALDQNGVAVAMLSMTAPGVSFGSVPDGRRFARELNDYAVASMVGTHKGRFGLFAVLPLPDVDGSLAEIEYAFDTLKVPGVGLLTSYGNQWLGDAAFAPVWAELNRRKAVVYTHPTDAACCPNLVPGVPAQMLEYPTDTTRAIVSLVASGTAVKYPDIRFVFSHAGGTITSVIGRLAGATANGDGITKPAPPDSRLAQLRRFYYDTAGAANVINMSALKTLATASQIVFGSDAPFFDIAPTAAGLQASGFTAQELRAVERDNALKLLPSLVGG
jgi:predicted TIM-barrel fold metal-dependent hydrolase